LLKFESHENANIKVLTFALGHWSRFGLAVATVTDRNENRRNA